MTMAKALRLSFLLSLLIQSISFAAPDNQEKRIALLEQQLQQSRKDVAVLQESLSKLQESLAIDDLIKNLDLTAYLKADSSGYVNFRFDLGYLTISILDIQPYADGTKVVLKIGNPLYTSINGISADIEWGRLNEKGYPTNNQNQKSFTFVESLRAGSWTQLTVVLGGTKPSDFGYIRFKNFQHTGIGLNK